MDFINRKKVEGNTQPNVQANTNDIVVYTRLVDFTSSWLLTCYMQKK